MRGEGIPNRRAGVPKTTRGKSNVSTKLGEEMNELTIIEKL